MYTINVNAIQIENKRISISIKTDVES